MIIGLLGNVDVIRIANDVGQAQEVCWRAVEALARGDLLGAGAQMTGLLPVGIDLAAAVVGSLTGGGTKTDPSQLGQTSTSAAAMTSAVGSGDLAGLAGQLVDMAGSDSVAQLIDVAKQGADVATFYASNVHTSYGADGSVQMLLDFILGQIT